MINLPMTHPALPTAMALRAHMKRTLLGNIAPGGDQASFYVLGSTLFDVAGGHRQFPFAGRRTGDLDLAVYCSPGGPKNSSARQGADKSAVGSVLQKAVEASGFQAMAGSSFAGKFTAGRTFTPEEIRLLVGPQPDLPTCASVAGITVLLEVDLNYHDDMTVLLPPGDIEAARVPLASTLKRDDWRQFLAKILVRSIRHVDFQSDKRPTSYNSSDLVSVYNIVKAEPAAVNLDPRSAHSDVKLMRLLTLVNLAVFRRRIEEIDLSSFDPTPENISSFRGSLKGIVFPESDLTDERISDILTTFQETVRAIFPKSPRGGRTPLHLTEKEAEFFELTHGYRTLPSGAREYPPPDPAVRVDLLDEDYGEIFSTHPHLREAIRNSPGLVELGQEIAEKRAAC